MFPKVRQWLREPGFRFGVVPVALLHVALSISSFFDPARAVAGDRAAGRLERAYALVHFEDRVAFMIEKGWPGDYGLHALLLGVGGLPLLLLVQLGLWLATLVLLYSVMRRRLLVPQWAAGTATTVYALLASNLHQPHTIVTEAFFNPAVAIVTLIVADILHRRDLSWLRSTALGGAAAAAILLRAVFLPVLPVVSVCLLATRSSRLSPLLLANVIALVPLFGWAGVQHLHGETVQLGGVDFSLEYNLAARMRRLHAMGGDAIPPSLAEEAGLGAYLGYAAANVEPFVTSTVIDAVMLVTNPGVDHTYGRFLGFFENSESTSYWRSLLDTRGLVPTVVEFIRRGPARLFWNGFGLMLWGGFCLVTLAGIVRMLRGPDWRFAFMLCMMAAILVAASFTAESVRWTHRSPIEFGFALLFSLQLVSYRSSRLNVLPESRAPRA